VRVPRPLMIVPVLTASLLLAGCSGSEESPQASGSGTADAPASEAPATDAPPADTPASDGPENTATTVGNCVYTPAEDGTGEAGPPSDEDLVTEGVLDGILMTSAGNIAIELDAAAAPCTVTSFRHLANADYFDESECHRLTTESIYVLQCGDPTGSGEGGPGYEFANENTEGATYGRGTLAMANAGPDTNGSQFFLVYDDSPLDPDYTVFGRVSEGGLAILDQIAAAGAEGGASDAAPATPVQIADVIVS